MSYNHVTLMGRLGGQPEVTFTKTGTAICKFSLATDRYTGKDEDGKKNKETDWHSVTVFGKAAEVVGKYVDKGDQLLVEGSIQYNKYQDKDGKERIFTNINCHQISLVEGKKDKAPKKEEPEAEGF